jgi:hypothetical protein
MRSLSDLWTAKGGRFSLAADETGGLWVFCIQNEINMITEKEYLTYIGDDHFPSNFCEKLAPCFLQNVTMVSDSAL